MTIRLLGPVELRTREGGAAEVAGAKRRGVLALLALELGRTVPVDRFFELLWGSTPPTHARAALQGHVAALRKVLDDTGLTLLTRPPGYRLVGPPEQVDARCFDELARRAGSAAADAEAAPLLQQALELWHGRALADVPDTELRHALAEQLEESRTRALTAWAQCLLRLGLGAAAIPELERSVRADGLREPTAALLMRCLYQAGRQSDALTAYHHTRVRLDDELGVTPGPALREALAVVLGGAPGSTRGTGPRPPATVVASAAAPPTPPLPAPPLPVPPPPTPPLPADASSARRSTTGGPGSGTSGGPGPGLRLPRPPSGFVGRSAALQWLDRRGTPGALAVVVGPAGAGKTATVLHWAQRAAGRFADGLLYADLRGYHPAGPADPTETLGELLLALGLPAHAIPADRAARTAAYQAQTRRRQLLLLLDNARDADDVSALLPAGTSSATVVTSRNTLEDLVVTEGAALLRVGPLPLADALELLEQLAPEQVAADPAAAHRLVDLCDGLPLALRIAAARIAARPDWPLARLVAELADEDGRLLALDTQGTASVRSSLALTYWQLPDEAAHLLALLGAHPGTEVNAGTAAALLGGEASTARHTLGTLAAHHLLHETSTGHFTRPDLVRLFSRELHADQDEPDRRLALLRLLDHYLGVLHGCTDPAGPSGPGLPGQPLPICPDAVRADPSGLRLALVRFRAEQPALRDLVGTAAGSADARAHERAVQIAELCHPLYALDAVAGPSDDWLTCLDSALRAARRSGTARALAVLESATAEALTLQQRGSEARVFARRAVDRTGAAHGGVRIRALAACAVATAGTGDPGAAREARELSRAALTLVGEDALHDHAGTALTAAATVELLAGDPEAALRHARAVRGRSSTGGVPTSRLTLLTALAAEAQALRRLRRFADAAAVDEESAELGRASGTLLTCEVIARQFDPPGGAGSGAGSGPSSGASSGTPGRAADAAAYAAAARAIDRATGQPSTSSTPSSSSSSRISSALPS